MRGPSLKYKECSMHYRDIPKLHFLQGDRNNRKTRLTGRTHLLPECGERGYSVENRKQNNLCHPCFVLLLAPFLSRYRTRCFWFCVVSVQFLVSSSLWD